MKINPRIYNYADPENIFESQDLGEHALEIYKLNDYPALLEEFTNKGKFAVWSSVDGVNYRLFIEEGYYGEVKDLYSKKINGIWLDFWDKCDKISNKFRNIVLPGALAVAVIIILLSYLLGGSMLSNILSIVICVVFLLVVVLFQKKSKKEMLEANKESVGEIKKYLTAKGFDELLERQRGYLDKYFKYDEETTEDEASVEEDGEIIDAPLDDTEASETENKNTEE